MQKVIGRLVSLGPLPAEKDADVKVIKEYEVLIQSIKQPLSIEEANNLVTLFSEDSCFGLAWTLLHMIEAAPGWSANEQLIDNGNEWIELLLKRERNHDR